MASSNVARAEVFGIKRRLAGDGSRSSYLSSSIIFTVHSSDPPNPRFRLRWSIQPTPFLSQSKPRVARLHVEGMFSISAYMIFAYLLVSVLRKQGIRVRHSHTLPGLLSAQHVCYMYYSPMGLRGD
ncbi:hypothetical protein VTO73DRAFT_10809 [Trametes versicolor]